MSTTSSKPFSRRLPASSVLGNVALPVSFDTKGLAAGVYRVRVTTPRGTATRRLVVQ
jgi:hypothetical protein